MRHLGTTVIPRARVNSPQLAKEEKSTYLRRVNREHKMIFDAISSGRIPTQRGQPCAFILTNSRERVCTRVTEES